MFKIVLDGKRPITEVPLLSRLSRHSAGVTAPMQKERFLRMAKAGIQAEWADILRDLDTLTEVEINDGGRPFLLRSRPGATRLPSCDASDPNRRPS